MPKGHAVDRTSAAERLRGELRRYAVVSAYLFVCFAVLLTYRTAVLGQTGTELLTLGLAAGKALVLGKFVLLGEATGLGRRVASPTLLGLIVRHTILLTLLLAVLTILEEIILGLVHHRGIVETLAESVGAPPGEIVARILVLLLVLVPLVTGWHLARALGPGVLGGLLRAPPPAARRED